MGTVRPWREEYQLLCTIDSVSGEMRSLSPFEIPRSLNLDDEVSTTLHMHSKVRSLKFLGAWSAGVRPSWRPVSATAIYRTTKLKIPNIQGDQTEN